MAKRRKRKYVAAHRGYDLNHPIDAQEIGENLEALGKDKTKEKVLELASDPSNALHKYFEWNDKIASKKFRLRQASTLLCSVSIETPEDGNVPAYVTVKVSEGFVKRDIEEVRSDQELIDQVLAGALRELKYWKDRHQHLQRYFSAVFVGITKAETAIRRKNEKSKKTKGRKKRK